MARKKTVTLDLSQDIQIAVGAGNLSLNGAIRVGDEIVTLTCPSIRSRASGYTLGLDNEIEREWVAYGKNASKFYVGEDVLIGLESRKAIDSHTGEKRYGSDMHLFLIDYMVARLLKKLQESVALDTGEIRVTLTTFLPPGLIKKYDGKVKAVFEGKNAVRSIRFKSDADPIQWRVVKVNIFPEGLHTWSCMHFDDAGKRQQSTPITGGTKVLMDGGGWSWDDYLIIGGRVDPESLKNATLQNGGLIHHVLSEVLDEVIALGGAFVHTTIYDIDKVIRNAKTLKHHRLVVGGESVDIGEIVKQIVEAYADYIAGNRINTRWNGLDEVDGAVLIGGGQLVIGKLLSAKYPNKFVDFASYEHLADILPTEMDVVGALREAEYQRRRAELQAVQ